MTLQILLKGQSQFFDHSSPLWVQSAPRAVAVVFLQRYDERGFEARAGSWIKAVSVGVASGVLTQVVVAFWLKRLLAAVVHHWMMVAAAAAAAASAAALLRRPVVATAAEYHHHSHSDQQQEGAASRQHIVPEGREWLRHHHVYSGLRSRYGTPWRAGGNVTGGLSRGARQACRLHWGNKSIQPNPFFICDWQACQAFDFSTCLSADLGRQTTFYNPWRY